MEITGKAYPRIHSISTVGIRNHININLLVHEMRTDFTGQSGSGKSLVGADIPQLILTAGRYYKSATKPKGNVSRDYNTLPLKDFGYCFMNIEVKKHSYLTIGVFIRRAPKQLYPFIVQSNMGIDSKNNPLFKPLLKPLRYQDFIVDDEILTLENVKEYLDKKDVYLTSYFHDIPSYHKLLNENGIIHMDLSADENLQRQYAHTLQSLARGDDIDTSGIKFKKFLFHYDDDVAVKFRTQAQQIEDDHERYVRDWETQNTLTKKKEILLNLLTLKKRKQEAFESRLLKETFYFHQLKKKKEKDYKETTQQYFSADLETLVIDEKLIDLEITKLEIEKKQKERDLETQEKLLKEANAQLETIGKELAEINESLPKLALEKDALKAKNDKIEKVKEWLVKYNTLEQLENSFGMQKSIIRQEEKLNQLNSFLNSANLYNLFTESEYAKSVKAGIEFYAKRSEHLNNEIAYLEKIKDIIVSQSANTFAGWAVKEQKPLNKLQESVLFHFATLQTSYDARENFIPNPLEFIEGMTMAHDSEKTFVINLNGLYYHIPKRQEYIFTNPTQLKNKIDQVGRNFQQKITGLREELISIKKLDGLFSELNYSEEHLAAYLNKDTIQIYKKDLTLNLTDDQFVEYINEYAEDISRKPNVKMQILYNEKLGLYEDRLGRKNRGNEIIANQNVIKIQSSGAIKEILVEIRNKEARIELLKNTEVKALEGKLILWKANLQNTLENKDQLYQHFKQRYKTIKEESELRKSQKELLIKSSPLAALIPQLTSDLPIFEANFKKKKEEFEMYFKTLFNENELTPIIADDDLQKLKTAEGSSKEVYEQNYISVFDEFKDDLKDSPKLRKHNFDLNSLILELIPHDIITNKENPEESLSFDIESKLSELHQKIKELSKEEATKIRNTVRDIRNIVNRQTTFLDQIKSLLQDFTLATYRKVQLQWSYSPDFDIKWIDALQKDITELNFEDNLFGERTKLNAHELLEKTFKKYCPNRLDAKAHEILNPFNYYDASAIIVDHNDVPSPGSTGQNYGMLALLCIAKLSIVEGKTKNAFQKIEPGIRILPIDEVAGLGENYDMLYEIAQRLDYQIFTMTISANDLEFEEGKQIYYEFIPNSKKELADYNEGVQACFSKDNLIHDLETYFEQSVFSLESTK